MADLMLNIKHFLPIPGALVPQSAEGKSSNLRKQTKKTASQGKTPNNAQSRSNKSEPSDGKQAKRKANVPPSDDTAEVGGQPPKKKGRSMGIGAMRGREPATGSDATPASSSSARPIAYKPKPEIRSGVVSELQMASLPIADSLKRQLEYLGFQTCTPIQAVAVPAAIGQGGQSAGPSKKKAKLKEKGSSTLPDVMLRAPTGSGKTLAFLLPVLHQLLGMECNRDDGTLVVILSPTKELALQTCKVASDLTRMAPHVVCSAVAGGEKPKSEKARLRKGAAVLCATPGRLAYHLEQTATFKTGSLRCLVLDEADRLLDMGFEKQVRQICDRIKSRRQEDATIRGVPLPPLQTLLVSATLTQQVRRLANFVLRPGAYWADPDAAELSTSSSSSSTKKGILGQEPSADVTEDIGFALPKSLTQWYVEVPLKERLSALAGAVASRARDGKKVIVFFSSCASVDFHHDLLLEAEWPSRGGYQKKKDDDAPRITASKDGFVGYAGTEQDGSDKWHNDEDEEAESEKDDDDEGEESEAESARADSDVELAQPARSSDAPSKPGEKMLPLPFFKLHGNLTKEERAGFIADFQKASCGVLLASDAASRGLDFPDIDWIIQYDPPQRTEEYLHRVGRTARIGRAGNSMIFLSPSELGFLDLLKSKGVVSLKRLDAHDLHRDLLRSNAPLEILRARDSASLIGASLKNHVEERPPLVKLARSAFLSCLKAYRAFPSEMRPCFPFKELHPGHLAGSFGLRESPKGIAKQERWEAKGSGKGGGGGAGRGARGSGGKAKGRGRGGGGAYEGAGGAPVRRGQLGTGGRAPARQLDRRSVGQDEFAS
mmetsp:Transcript_35376/g.75418  ORF Transcript_35376/g.75418 Transcript_35376/m.75418 type:complete len:831 (-) Transcript_35376:223-2715(-)